MSDFLHERRSDDAGFSLIELLVSMGLMSVVMVMVVGGLFEVYSDVNRADGLASSREQITTSFRRLDKEVRYANWLSPAGKVGGNYYLEYATPPPVNTTRPPKICRQLVYKSGVLTLASWNPTLTSTPETPTTIATDLTLTGTQDPFTIILPGDSPNSSASPGTAGTGTGYVPQHSQLRLRFTAKYATVTMPVDVLFTAQNTTSYNVFGNNRELLDNDCSKGRPTS
ncbi:prepilin-type N-terminal cleavage/methylation domain-containing protein [Actinoplanes lutulentus]|uniref:Prepilin-type N-terminal cleavage/methylation domain-containing protein n=1 Tax=Actinoplanes lutulentus TaxID=1287878 RepID=A0A327YZL0_9ACTN|nr:prepilin-type N-terminal cleavage/methylation domain-containing protein [Actinoplanes lutulentus]MBB2946605.1 prepilin-type N-terminal cleavage/methylation domain-containing protein [Actinoplanes lutulentus]RAK26523.1 prepilin-type N-terminal cleavage/methylation domain-containing protein [Actinoplanes lutulentus]